VGSASEKVTKSGKASLATKLNGAGNSLVAKSGKAGLSVAVTATYLPTKGKDEVASKTVVIR
jgi:hypothetical protein